MVSLHMLGVICAVFFVGNTIGSRVDLRVMHVYKLIRGAWGLGKGPGWFCLIIRQGCWTVDFVLCFVRYEGVLHTVMIESNQSIILS